MGLLLRLRCHLLVALLACTLGCSGDRLHRVEGKVLVDGKGAEGAVVIFHPKDGDPIKSQRPSAIVAADGTFSLTTGLEDGAAAGEYLVTITWPGDPPAPKPGKPISMGGDEPDRPDRLGGRYADVKASKLQATVRPGKNQLEPFEVR